METLIILWGSFLVLLLFEVPIAVSLALAAFAAFLHNHIVLTALAQRMFVSIDSFPLMAIPFFMLAGALMEYGGISRRIIAVAEALVGHYRGGLAQVTVVACGFFAALSGSSTATVAAIGSLLYPALVKANYDKSFAAGTVAAGGELGPIIPPSIPMIVIGSITDVSVGALFLGGVTVGLFTLFVFLTYVYITSKVKKYGQVRSRLSTAEMLKAIGDCVVPIGMPVIILGGIYSGLFTPTEAAAIAVLYALIIGFFVYRTLTISMLPRIFVQSAINAAVIMFIIASSSSFSWVFARQGCAQIVSDWFNPLYSSPMLFLLVSSGIMIVFGMFIEGISFTILLMPIFFPITRILGIHPVQFGLVTTVCIVIGCLTPPVAVNIYAAASVTGLEVNKVMRGVIPYLLCMLFVLTCVILFPSLSTFLPDHLN